MMVRMWCFVMILPSHLDDESLPDMLSLRRSASTEEMLSVRRNLPHIVRSKLPVHYRSWSRVQSELRECFQLLSNVGRC